VKIVTSLTAIALLTTAAFSQTPAPANQTDSSPAKSIGMFAYPKNSQGPDQQLADEQLCYGSVSSKAGSTLTLHPRRRRLPANNRRQTHPKEGR